MPDIPQINDAKLPRAPLDATTSDKSWNQTVDQIEQLGLSLANIITPAGGSARVFEYFLGLVSDPPSGGTAYADCRYWIRRAVPIFANDSTDQLGVQYDPLANGTQYGQYVTATNRAELPKQTNATTKPSAGTHLLQTNQAVLVFAFPEQGNAAKKTYVFHASPIRPCLVRVTGTAGGGGKYFGRIIQAPAADVSYSSDLSDADVGANGGPNDVLILNTREVGKITHDIDISGTFLPTVFVGFRSGTNSDGTLIVVIDGRQGEPCAV